MGAAFEFVIPRCDLFDRADFGVLSTDVSLKYVIEGEPADYQVRCADGCSGIGKCGNPTVAQVQVREPVAVATRLRGYVVATA